MTLPLPNLAVTGAAGSAVAAGQPGVAAVVIDTPLAHLDRPFEYAVPPELAAAASPGVRVRVRFAGRDVDGFILERRAVAEHPGRLTPLRSVVSPEPVLTPEVLALARAVADRYAGTLADVLRLAVPKRHAGAERALPVEPAQHPDAPDSAQHAEAPDPAGAEAAPGPGSSAWAPYPAGAALLRRLADGQSPRATWLAAPCQPPATDWPLALAQAASATLDSGRGVVIVVPDHRDVARVDRALIEQLGTGRHVRLTADQGAQARYTAYLKLLRGHVRCVVGTRAAAFAPVADPGLLAWWDDGDDLHREPRAPYPQVRQVLRLRAELSAAGLLVGGFGRTVEVADWVQEGFLVPVAASPATLRVAAPRVVVAGEGLDAERDGPAARAHLPAVGWRAAKAAVATGPVLVQVPRRGYLPALACAHCQAPVRCEHCQGPMAVPAPGLDPQCRWGGHRFGPNGFICPACGGRRLRSVTVGARRTAEEIGRAFPGVPVVTSGSGQVLEAVGPEPAIVIATPGAEPTASGGYRAGLLLDAWALLGRSDLDAPVEALRRWLTAGALLAPGAPLVLGGVPTGPDDGGDPSPAGGAQWGRPAAVEALVRWDPAWLAERELAERRELGLPPISVVATVSGPRRAVASAVEEALAAAPAAEGLGPLPLDADTVRTLIRAPGADRADLSRTLRSVRAGRSARKESESVVIAMEPALD